jgi:hypothetical protein
VFVYPFDYLFRLQRQVACGLTPSSGTVATTTTTIAATTTAAATMTATGAATTATIGGATATTTTSHSPTTSSSSTTQAKPTTTNHIPAGSAFGFVVLGFVIGLVITVVGGYFFIKRKGAHGEVRSLINH